MTNVTPSNIDHAVALLRTGKLVAFPTETVYGLGADARNEQAVREIFRVKERPLSHPLIVHLASLQQLDQWTSHFSEAAFLLAKTYWPGPLTLVLPKKAGVLDMVTGGQATVALRIPNHPVAQSLLQAFGSGIAAPSANKFTHVSPTTAADVYDELGESVDLILDGGACQVGLESTIVDMSGHQPVVLRPGMISVEMISQTLGMPVQVKGQASAVTRVPGQHLLHYAPLTKTILLTRSSMPACLQNLSVTDLPIAIMTVGALNLPSFAYSHGIYWINMSTNPAQYAHDLYHTLRDLDHQHFKQIVIEAVPEGIAWDAIRDRIAKATFANRSTS